MERRQDEAARQRYAERTPVERPPWWDVLMARRRTATELLTKIAAKPPRIVARAPGRPYQQLSLPHLAGSQPAAGSSDRATETIEETAHRYGIGRGLAYELARRGQLPGVIRLGKRLLVARAVTDRVLSQGASE
jgi:hypothetical protein